MTASEISLGWEIITGLGAAFTMLILLLGRVAWVLGKMRLEIQVTLTDHERRLEEAEKKITTLFNFHNERVRK